jgi:hypothetical protein
MHAPQELSRVEPRRFEVQTVFSVPPDFRRVRV